VLDGNVDTDGDILGTSDGTIDIDGMSLGTSDGNTDTDGNTLGTSDGTIDIDGMSLGDPDGINDTDGDTVGASVKGRSAAKHVSASKSTQSPIHNSPSTHRPSLATNIASHMP